MSITSETYNGNHIDFYLSENNDTVLLKNITNNDPDIKSLCEIKAKNNQNNQNLNISFSPHLTDINTMLQKSDIIKSLYLKSNNDEFSKSTTYELLLDFGKSSCDDSSNFEAYFNKLYFYKGFTNSKGEITFKFENSTFNDNSSNYLKASITNNFISEKINNLDNYIYFIDEINYTYGSSTVNFYKEGNYNSNSNIDNHYNIDFPNESIEYDKYLSQEVILYKGIEYKGKGDWIFNTKSDHDFYKLFSSINLNNWSNNGTLTMNTWSDGNYDYCLSNDNNKIILKGLVYDGIDQKGYTIKSMSIEIIHNGNSVTEKRQLTFNSHNHGDSYNFDTVTLNSNQTIPKGPLQAKTYIDYYYNKNNNLESVIFTNSPLFNKLYFYEGFVDNLNNLNFNFESANIKNYDNFSNNLKANISNYYLSNNLNDLKDKISFIDDILYIYKGNNFTKSIYFYKGGTINQDIVKKNNSFVIDMQSNIKSNYFIYQEISYNDQIIFDNITKKELTKNSKDLHIQYSNSLENYLENIFSLSLGNWINSNRGFDFNLSKNVITLNDLIYEGIDNLKANLKVNTIEIYINNNSQKASQIKSLIPIKNNYSSVSLKSSNSEYAKSLLSIMTSVDYSGENFNYTLLNSDYSIKKLYLEDEYVDADGNLNFNFSNASISNNNINSKILNPVIDNSYFNNNSINNNNINFVDEIYYEYNNNNIYFYKSDSFIEENILDKEEKSFTLKTNNDIVYNKFLSQNVLLKNNIIYKGSTNYKSSTKSNYNFYLEYLNNISNSIENYVNENGTLTMIPWSNTHTNYSYDYYLSTSNDIIILKGLEYKEIDYPEFEISNMSIHVIKNGDNNIVSNSKSLSIKNGLYNYPEINLKSISNAFSNNELKTQTIITYTGINETSVIKSITFTKGPSFYKLFFYKGFTDSTGNLTFGFEKSSIKNYNSQKKSLKAMIGNYFFTENQDNLSEKINFINNINYVYKGLNINKSVNFFNNGDIQFNIDNDEYNIDMDTDIQYKAFLYQYIELNNKIIYKGFNKGLETTYKSYSINNYDFYVPYLKANVDLIENKINNSGSLIMKSWNNTNDKYTYDYFMSSANNTIVLKGIQYQNIKYDDFSISSINISISSEPNGINITKSQLLTPVQFAPYKSIKAISLDKASIPDTETLYIKSLISYKGINEPSINTTIVFPTDSQSNLIQKFKKLQFIDYRFDFQNAIIKNISNSIDILNAEITADVDKGILALNNGDIKSESINKINYFFSKSITNIIDSINVFDNSFNDSIEFNNNNYIINSEDKWNILLNKYLFQEVIINPNIIINESYITNNICTTKNNTFLYVLPSPIYIKAYNSNPNYKSLTGVSDISIDISQFEDSSYNLYIGTGKSDISSISSLENIKSFKGTSKAFKGIVKSLLQNYTYNPSNKLYSYVESFDTFTKSFIKSGLSNSIVIPINDINPPLNVGYSNFWPYILNGVVNNGSIEIKGKGNFSGGPIEIYKSDSNNNTREGYYIYRDNNNLVKNKGNIKYEIPLQFNKGDYFFVKGYSYNKAEIISLSNINPFNTDEDEMPLPIDFPDIKSNSTLNVVSWGYERFTVKDDLQIRNSDNIISNNPILFDLGIRDKASIIPNYIKSNNKHIKSSFINYVDKPFYFNTKGVLIIDIIETPSIKIDSGFLSYGIEYEKLYMMGIKETSSIWCDKAGNNKGLTNNLNNLIYRLQSKGLILKSNNNYQIYQIESKNVKANEEVNNISNELYYKSLSNNQSIFIKQTNIFYSDNTKNYSPDILNKTISEITPNISDISYTQSGCGGRFSCIYMNDIKSIDNIMCIAGGGGGSGIYSSPGFKATKTIYNGHDGVALEYKEIKSFNYQNYTSEINYIDGGQSGAFNENENGFNSRIYQIPSGSLGGSVHTFKNLVDSDNYVKPIGNGFIPNYGFYPNFNTSQNKIISPPMNGKPFYTVKGNKISYKGTIYTVDSFGLEKSGEFYGNGGSANNIRIFTVGGKNIDEIKNWGVNGNEINYNDKDPIYRNYLTYSQGGGGGGGFGGGSAGSYFFYQKSNKNKQTLNNVPPGGGGGGNSFYNVKNKGLAYGINTKNIKSNSNNIPSILPQMLKLALPNRVKSFSNSEYLKGERRLYMYMYTGKG